MPEAGLPNTGAVSCLEGRTLLPPGKTEPHLKKEESSNPPGRTAAAVRDARELGASALPGAVWGHSDTQRLFCTRTRAPTSTLALSLPGRTLA